MGIRPSGRARIEGVALAAALAWLAIGPGSAWAQGGFEALVNVSNTAGDSIMPHMVVGDDGTLHVAWTDDTGQPGSPQIFYTRSSDGGHTFAPPRVISASANGSFRPRLAVRGSALYVVWMEDVSDTKDIIFTRSLDGGASFEPPRNISNTAGQSFEARVAVNAAGTVFVVWDEATPSRHIAIARSFDQGVSFAVGTAAPLFRPLTDCPVDASPSSCTAYPGLAVDPVRPDNVYVTWHDKLPGHDLSVYFTRSTDGGGSFETPRDVAHPMIHAHCASINVGPGGKILVAWENRKQPASTGVHHHDSYFAQSVDGGVSFGPPVNVSQSPNSALSDYPWAAEGPDGTIVVGYEDNAVGGALDAVVNASKDGGLTFGPRIDVSNNPLGTSTEVITRFAPDGTLYVLWEDHGDGDETVPGEILFARAPGASLTGTPPLALSLSPGTASFRPGQPATVSVTASNPGAPGVVDVYFGATLPPAAGPMFGCPAGNAVVYFTPGLAGLVTVCGTPVLPPPAAYPRVFIPGGLPAITVPVLSFVWPGGLPAGDYRFFMLATSPGAAGNGVVGSAETVASGAAHLNYAP